MKTRILEWTVAVVVAGSCAAPPTHEEAVARARWSVPLTEEIRAVGERAVAEDGIVGLAIGIALDGELVFAEGFGHSDAARTRPVTPATVFDVASVGKQFTAAAIMKLVEDGRLSLDARTRDLVPRLPVQFPDATVGQLLQHTSGYVGGKLDELAPPPDFARRRYGLELLTDPELETGEARFDTGETWIYCNPGYLMLGLIVEVASGQRYDEFVREALIRSGGLDDLWVCERGPEERMAQALHRHEDGSIAPVPFIDMTAYSGQGSICASLVGLMSWARALGTGRVVSPESFAQMRTPAIVSGDHGTGWVPYGFGQRLGQLGGFAKAGHTGTFAGGSTALFDYPVEGLTIAVLTNTRGSGTPHARSYEIEIAKAVLGLRGPTEIEPRLLSEAERQAIEGTYAGASRISARTDGDLLVVMEDGREVERLVHVGDLHFRRPDQPDVEEWFLLDGDRAGWWVYDVGGAYQEVLRRVPE